MQRFYEAFSTALGLDVQPKDLTFVHVSLRGLFVFIITLVIIRLGHKRSLARKTPFDAVLLVIVASVLARAINGSASFFPALGGGLVLVLFHRLLGFAAYRWHWFGILIKGRPEIVVSNGQHHRRVMFKNHVSDHDIEEDMRLNAHTEDLSQIRMACIERSGDISFIKNAD